MNPLNLVLAYVVMSIVTFGVYAFDKSAARRGAWRVSEKNLHALALFCGWPGAFMAQRKLRHKSSKQSFLQVFWITVIGNIGGVIYLCSQ